VGLFAFYFSRGRKCPASEVEIGERQQREHLRSVLCEAAITHLAEAKLAFQNTEHVFDLRAHLAEPAIAGALTDRDRRPVWAFSFTAQSTPAASAARRLAPLA
jgi:hypothetical protein